jgi:hypothetical protein
LASTSTSTPSRKAGAAAQLALELVGGEGALDGAGALLRRVEGGAEEVELVLGALLAGVAVDQQDLKVSSLVEPEGAAVVAGQGIVGELELEADGERTGLGEGVEELQLGLFAAEHGELGAGDLAAVGAQEGGDAALLRGRVGAVVADPRADPQGAGIELGGGLVGDRGDAEVRGRAGEIGERGAVDGEEDER